MWNFSLEDYGQLSKAMRSLFVQYRSLADAILLVKSNQIKCTVTVRLHWANYWSILCILRMLPQSASMMIYGTGYTRHNSALWNVNFHKKKFYKKRAVPLKLMHLDFVLCTVLGWALTQLQIRWNWIWECVPRWISYSSLWTEFIHTSQDLLFCCQLQNVYVICFRLWILNRKKTLFYASLYIL